MHTCTCTPSIEHELPGVLAGISNYIGRGGKTVYVVYTVHVSVQCFTKFPEIVWSCRMEYAVQKSPDSIPSPRAPVLFTCECSMVVSCLSAVEPKHCTALFTAKRVELRWPERLTELLCVPVRDSDKLPGIFAACTDLRWTA